MSSWRLAAIIGVAINQTGPSKLSAQKPGVDETFEVYALKTEEPHDLLAMVKLPDHALRGNWKCIDESLVCEPADDAQLMLPVALKGSYSIECEFTRRSGEETIVVVLPVGNSSTAILLSGWTGAASGIARVDGRDARDSRITPGAAVRPGKLVNGQRYQLKIEVKVIRDRAIIQASLNGRRFVMWRGLTSQVSYWAQYSIACQQAVALIAHKSAADFHKCELTVAKRSEAYRLDDKEKSDWLTPLTRVADEPPKHIAAQCATWKGRKYYMTDKPVNIVTARRLATELKGRLLTISSKEEEDFFFRAGRGVRIWLSGWRRSSDRVWRDERNRALRYHGRWGPRQPIGRYWETLLGIATSSGDVQGWHDFFVSDKLHACIEWGEEYPDKE